MMTQDEIIRMAREAGAEATHYQTWGDVYEFDMELLERFAALVAQNYMAKACGGCVIKQCYKRMDAEIEAAIANEREACAKVCEQLGALNTATPQKIAASIRARDNREK